MQHSRESLQFSSESFELRSSGGLEKSNIEWISKHSVTVQRDTTSLEYLGNAGPSSYKANQTYNSVYEQRNNNKKIHQSHTNQGNMQMLNNTENLSVRRSDNDRNNNRMFIPSNGPRILPSKETHGKMGGSQQYDNSICTDRINEDILSAFKKNPYTQSLQSVA